MNIDAELERLGFNLAVIIGRYMDPTDENELKARLSFFCHPITHKYNAMNDALVGVIRGDTYIIGIVVDSRKLIAAFRHGDRDFRVFDPPKMIGSEFIS